jgi:hypothetical protein
LDTVISGVSAFWERVAEWGRFVGVAARVTCGSFRAGYEVSRRFPQPWARGPLRAASSGRCVRSYSMPRWSRPINGLPSSFPDFWGKYDPIQIRSARFGARPRPDHSQDGCGSITGTGSVRQRRPGRLAHVDVSPSALIRRPSLSGHFGAG